MKIQRAAKALRQWIFPNRREKLVREWFRIRGDATLRLEYDLCPDSVVLDVGGFEGQWASDIFGRYLCRIYICEPVFGYAESIKKRFSRNPRIATYAIGLGGRTRRERIHFGGDGSSIIAGGASCGEVEIVDVAAWLGMEGLVEIDLIKLNIEGAEYELLERAIQAGCIPSWRNIQIQFHDNVRDAWQRRALIRTELSRTHDLKYNYDFVWEGWTRKERAL